MTDERAIRKSVEKQLVQLESSVAAPYALAPKLTESEKSSQTVRVEVASLKENMTRTNRKQADSDTFVLLVRMKLEKLLVILNIALVGCNRVE